MTQWNGTSYVNRVSVGQVFVGDSPIRDAMQQILCFAPSALGTLPSCGQAEVERQETEWTGRW